MVSRRHSATLLAAVLVLCQSLSTPPALAQPVPASPSVQVFTEPDAHLTPVFSLIRQATRSIRLEVYLLTSRSIVTELERAQRRGVSVRVLLEEHPFGGQQYAQLGYGLLRAAGVSVRWANEAAFTYTHEKAMVVDDRLVGIFTFNLTSSGLYRNREFGVIESNAADGGVLASIFDADWNRRAIRPGTSRLVVSPVNSRHSFLKLIDGARHTLDLYAEEVADGSIEDHLIAAVRRHVRVRLITSRTSAGVETLQRGGVGVTILTSPYVHAKAIVSDGSSIFIGSENISSTSLDANREVGIALNDGALASVVERTFAADWRGNGTRSHAGPSSPTSTPSLARSGFAVTVTTSAQTVRRGQELSITAGTTPGAACTIRVRYPDGYVSRAAALRSVRTAGSDGMVSWTWRIGSTVTGSARADVTCRLGSRLAAGHVSFDIR